MKKWLKIIASLLVIILVILYVSISKIDTSPYFESSYYHNTIANINVADSIRKTSKGRLLAGFARMNITPTIMDGDASNGEFNKIKLAGFGDGQIATGVHDSIFAKAIALEVNGETIVLVSADLLMMAETVVEGIEKELKGKSTLARDHIIFGATHTHSSMGSCVPGIIGEGFGGEYQPKFIEWISKKFTKLILNALKDKKPSQLSSGYINVPHLVSNRIIGETGRLNDKLSIISIKQDSAKQAVIGVFAAHATTISSWNSEYSADYPGYFQRSLENSDIDMALFYAGTVGSHTNRGEGQKFDKPKYVGENLALAAKKCINTLEYSSEVELSLLSAEIEVPKLQLIHITDRLRLSPYVGNKLIPKMNRILLQGLKINNLIWTALPYEFSGEYAIDLKNALELKGYNSIYTSFNGQYLGYIVPAKYYYYDTYEARLMGWYGPSMGDYLVELNYKLAHNLTKSKL